MKTIRHRVKARNKHILNKKQRKLFYLVKENIDKWDPYCLLRNCGCPPEEFNYESEMITKLINENSTLEEINFVVSKVFSTMFEPQYFQLDQCLDVAQNIQKSIREEYKRIDSREGEDNVI